MEEDDEEEVLLVQVLLRSEEAWRGGESQQPGEGAAVSNATSSDGITDCKSISCYSRACNAASCCTSAHRAELRNIVINRWWYVFLLSLLPQFVLSLHSHPTYALAGAFLLLKRIEIVWSPSQGASVRWRATPQPSAAASSGLKCGGTGSSSAGADKASVPGSSCSRNKRKHVDWREKVSSPHVEQLFEDLADGILQEFVYDLWYRQLTPDSSAPDAAKSLLCTIFGELSQRARAADLRRLILRDAVEVLARSLERMRKVKHAVGGDVLDSMTRSAKERAIVRELASSGMLHPALLPGESEVTVLSRMLTPIIPHLVPDNESQLVVHLTRELLSGSVLRPLAGLCTPKWVNKGILMTLAHLNLLEQCRVDNRIKQRFTEKHDHEPNTSTSIEAATPSRFKRWREAQRQRRRANLASNMRDIPIYDLKGILDTDDVQLDNTSSGTGYTSNPQTGTGRSLHDALEYGDADGSNFNKASFREQPPQAVADTNSIPADNCAFRASIASSDDGRSPANISQASSPKSGNLGYLRTVPLDSDDDDDDDEQHCSWWRSTDPAKGGVGTPRPEHKSSAFEAASESRHRRAASADEETLSSSFESELKSTTVPHRSRRVAAGVVGAETVMASTGPYVVFTVRVRSVVGEIWTVYRRYKNFERLHRRIRNKAGPGELKLPPKRLLASALSDRLVSDRRAMLDSYLKAVLASDQLAVCEDVQDFLSQHSNQFAHARESKRLMPVSGVPSVMNAHVGSLPHTASAQGLVGLHDVPGQQRDSSTSLNKLSSSEPKESGGERLLLEQPQGTQPNGPLLRADVDDEGYEEDSEVESHNDDQRTAAVASSNEEQASSAEAFDESTFHLQSEPQIFASEYFSNTNAGLSAHLLRLVDRVFCLRSIGAFQWTLYSIMHHVLSALHIDDRLDDLLGSQLAALRTEQSVVKGLRWLRDSLWPGGVWFQRAALTEDSEADLAMEADNTRNALLRLGEESAVVNNIIGKQRYRESAHDVYEMLQSPTFCAQIGYELVEVMLSTLFPEFADHVICKGSGRMEPGEPPL